MNRPKPDFSGWATKNDLKCSDGRTIRHGAFKNDDGKKVPLVWSHRHDDPADVLGHAILENRDDGVYAYCYFNDGEKGKNAKIAVQHGDVVSLSIYANQLKQNAGDVVHGVIREVSLVLAGANPGAFIDIPVLEHSDETGELYFNEAQIWSGDEELVIAHADDSEKEEKEPVADEKKPAEKEGGKTIGDVLATLTDDQKIAVGYLLEQAAKGKTEEKTDDKGEDEMKHNAFDNEAPANTLSHADIEQIFADAKSSKFGSLKAAVEYHMQEGVLAHSAESDAAAGITRSTNEQDYGFNQPSFLFPEAHNLSNVPYVIDRDQTWVQKVMRGVHRSPFSRVRTTFADITADEARAKGYVKGNQKVDEVITLAKRVTEPQTVYKRQKMDRDDILDITDFDAVAFLKGEMRGKLDEEIARAILISDGRSPADNDKIKVDRVRPIVSDDDLFTVKTTLNAAATAKDFIRSVIRTRKQYKGSGNPTLFTTEDMISDMLLLEDNNGRFIYESVDKLATTLRVKEIVAVEVMEGAKNDDGAEILGIIVNLSDYSVGADKGGAVEMFDDFDIDFNQYKYLIETRISGALTKYHSAMAFFKTAAAGGNG